MKAKYIAVKADADGTEYGPPMLLSGLDRFGTPFESLEDMLREQLPFDGRVVLYTADRIGIFHRHLVSVVDRLTVEPTGSKMP